MIANKTSPSFLHPLETLIAISLTLLPCSSRSTILINEIDSDQPGTDSEEFVELYNTDPTAVNLTAGRYVLVFFNGSATSPPNASYHAYDLTGTIPPNGYFIIGSSTVPNLNLTPSGWPATNAIQNGADAVALYSGKGSIDFPNGTAPTTLKLVDALVYDTSDADDIDLLNALTPGQPQISEGTDGLDSIQRVPDGCGGALHTKAYVRGPRTPGAANSSPASPVLTCAPTPRNSASDWSFYE